MQKRQVTHNGQRAGDITQRRSSSSLAHSSNKDTLHAATRKDVIRPCGNMPRGRLANCSHMLTAHCRNFMPKPPFISQATEIWQERSRLSTLTLALL